MRKRATTLYAALRSSTGQTFFKSVVTPTYKMEDGMPHLVTGVQMRFIPQANQPRDSTSHLIDAKMCPGCTCPWC